MPSDGRNQIILALFAVAIFLWVMNTQCSDKSSAKEVPSAPSLAPSTTASSSSSTGSGGKKDGFLTGSLRKGIRFTPGADKVNGIESERVTSNLQQMLFDQTYG
jgi:hypothetical protein